MTVASLYIILLRALMSLRKRRDINVITLPSINAVAHGPFSFGETETGSNGYRAIRMHRMHTFYRDGPLMLFTTVTFLLINCE